MLKFKEQIDALPQDDSAHEAQKLIFYSFIRSMKPETVVEVGTHKGATTLYLAHGCYDNGKGHVYTYDPFLYGQMENFAKFPELDEYITFIQEPATNCNLESIDFLFIDGFHEREHVLAEIDNLFPLLSKESVAFFHDSGGDNARVGVNAAVEEAGIKTILLPTEGRMHLYSNFKL